MARFEPKITDAAVRAAAERIESGESITALAEELGVSRVTLWRRIKALPAAVTPGPPRPEPVESRQPDRPVAPVLPPERPVIPPPRAPGGRLGWPSHGARARDVAGEHDGRVVARDGVRSVLIDPSRADEFRAAGYHVTLPK